MNTRCADLVKWFTKYRDSSPEKYLCPSHLHYLTGIGSRPLSWALWELFDKGVIERKRQYSPYTQRVCWCYRLKG